MFWLGVSPESHCELPFSVGELLSGLGSVYFRVQGPLGAREWWKVQPRRLGPLTQEDSSSNPETQVFTDMAVALLCQLQCESAPSGPDVFQSLWGP